MQERNAQAHELRGGIEPRVMELNTHVVKLRRGSASQWSLPKAVSLARGLGYVIKILEVHFQFW